MTSAKYSTFIEYADAIWLTCQIASLRGISLPDLLPKSQQSSEEGNEPPIGSPVKETSSDNPPPPTPPSGGMVVSSIISTTEVTYKPKVRIDGTFVPIPGFEVSKIHFHRSLKPLKKRVPSFAVPPQVDIDETLHQIARNYIAQYAITGDMSQETISLRSDIPVFTHGKERWLDLVLVVDKSAPMSFFKQQLDMFISSMEESGVFRKIHLFYVVEKRLKEHAPPRPCIYKRNYIPHDRLESHENDIYYNEIEQKSSSLIDPAGRRIVLFLSTCTSKMWHDWTTIENDENGSSIGKIIQEVGKKHPTAILQMLPERLWLRSGISYFQYCYAWAQSELSPNSRLRLSIDEAPKDGFAVPILSFDIKRLLAWTKMVAGKADAPVLCMYVPKKYTERQRDMSRIDMEDELSERINLFLHTAPKQAVQFAGSLSVMLDLTKEELKDAQKDLFPFTQSEFMADIIANNLLVEGNDSKVQLIRSLEHRSLFWEKMSPLQKLKAMSYYYENVAFKQGEKFYNKNDDGDVDFWAYLDDRNANPRNVLPREAGKSMYDLFEMVLDFSKNPEEKEELRGDGEDKFVRPNLEFDFTSARTITEHSHSYLSLPLINIGVWGAPGVGKTSFLMSMARDLFLQQNSQFTMERVDHYGNVSQDINMYRKPSEFDSPSQSFATKKMRDYLFLLSRHTSGGVIPQQKMFCIHDLPGESSINMDGLASATYKNCDVLLLFIPADKIILPSVQDKEIATRHAANLLNWLQSNHYGKSGMKLRSVYIVVTKCDMKSGEVLENMKEPSEFWSYLKGYLDSGIVKFLSNQVGKVFVTSSFGRSKKEWTPINTITPLEYLLDQ